VFKSLMIYRIGTDWSPTLEAMEAALDGTRFVACGATQDKSVGWSEPRGEAHGPLVESVGGHWIMKLMLESKAVPSSVVQRKMQEQIDAIEASTGRQPGKKERKTLREDALLSLLPQAFARQSSVWVWIDRESRLLLTDAGSQSKVDDIITSLVSSLPGLSLTLLQTNLSPQTAMTEWLTVKGVDELPPSLSVERECELKSADEQKSVVRFTRHNLATEEVRKHITEGKLPTKLALSWEGRVAFVLSETMQLKKINFLEGVFDGTSSEKEDGFDADVALSTGELRKLVADLIEALGGEQNSATVQAMTAVVTDDNAPF
jgi:recombination associated protein RdgC